MTAALALAVGLVPSETTHKPTPLQTLRHGRAGFTAVNSISIVAQRKMRLTRMKKTVITGARLAVEDATRGGFRGSWAMVTLTYREGVAWNAKQLTRLTNHVRMYAKKAGFLLRYVWVLELTARGRPHYHLLVWLPAGRTLPKPDKKGWWPHGKTRVEWARNAINYIAKYASKGITHEQADLIPKGARLCGTGGLTPASRIELRWWKLPVWVREKWAEVTNVARVPGGFLHLTTGEYLPSPWKVVFLGGSVFLLKRDDA